LKGHQGLAMRQSFKILAGLNWKRNDKIFSKRSSWVGLGKGQEKLIQVKGKEEADSTFY